MFFPALLVAATPKFHSAVRQFESPIRREHLQNGAVILDQWDPSARYISLHLVASSAYFGEQNGNGIRHLLEHLIVRGPKGTIDTDLELVGGFMTASTTRDVMDIAIEVPKGEFTAGLDAIQKVLHEGRFTQDDVQREQKAIQQEAALEQNSSLLAAGAWKLAYGPAGDDPVGDLAIINAATAAEIEKAYAHTFFAGNIVLSVTSPDPASSTLPTLEQALNGLPKQTFPSLPPRQAIANGGRVIVPGKGEALGLSVPSFSSPKTMASVAAALAVAYSVKGSFFIYTPSVSEGMVLVGDTSSDSSITRFVSNLTPEAMHELFPVGFDLALGWVQNKVNNSREGRSLASILLAEDFSAKPKQLENALSKVTETEFVAALQEFSSKHVFISLGSGE